MGLGLGDGTGDTFGFCVGLRVGIKGRAGSEKGGLVGCATTGFFVGMVSKPNRFEEVGRGDGGSWVSEIDEEFIFDGVNEAIRLPIIVWPADPTF